MLLRSFVYILLVASFVVFVTAQTPDAAKSATDKVAGSKVPIRPARLRDLRFPDGLDLQTLIRDLALEMELNVVFDPDSFRTPRKTSIVLANVTLAEALDYILLQEKLVSEEIGPKTMLVASQYSGRSIPEIDVGVTPLTTQLAQYFGAPGGILINNVRPDSPGFKAGFKAGDVILGFDDGVVFRGPVGLIRAIKDKNDGDLTLRIVRDHKERKITLTHPK